MEEFDADRDDVVDRARDAGVEDFVLIGGVDGEQGHQRALRVADSLGCRCTAGVHPHEARHATLAVYDEIQSLAREGRIAAIGEVGLDFHYDHSPREVQREVFRRQIRLARDLGLPLVIHTREADAETVAILDEEGAREVGGVIHCFTGTRALGDATLGLGFHISFSGIVAFPRATGIQDVARLVPLDRLLVETDSPFLAPPPHRGKRNEPAFVVEVATAVARLRGVDVIDVARASTANARRLFDLERAGVEARV
jgi:TatD DNase family protein